jgi:hypothetical protein
MDTAREIDSAVDRLYSKKPERAGFDDEGEPTKRFRSVEREDDSEETSPRPKFDFENLKFGYNYTAD